MNYLGQVASRHLLRTKSLQIRLMTKWVFLMLNSDERPHFSFQRTQSLFIIVRYVVYLDKISIPEPIHRILIENQYRRVRSLRNIELQTRVYY